MKNNKIIYKTSIFFLLLISLNACLWPTDVVEIRIDQESKDYCLFGRGSYWIYQDSATKKIDSIVISRDAEYEFIKSKGLGYETYMIYALSYSQDSTNDNVYFNLTTDDADPKTLKPCMLFASRIKYHNGEIGENFSDFKDLVILRNKYAEYELGNLIFDDVKIFSFFENDNGEIYYWARHVGLIREEIYAGDSVSIRNLIRYDVKQ